MSREFWYLIRFWRRLQKLCARSISAVYALAKEKQISIETEKVEECMPVHNPKWTAEAIGNILENAVEVQSKRQPYFHRNNDDGVVCAG